LPAPFIWIAGIRRIKITYKGGRKSETFVDRKVVWS